MKTINAFNVNTQTVEEATVAEGNNGELVIRFADLSFFKLPGGMTDEDLVAHLETYELANTGQIKVEEPVVEEEPVI